MPNQFDTARLAQTIEASHEAKLKSIIEEIDKLPKKQKIKLCTHMAMIAQDMLDLDKKLKKNEQI